MTIVFGREDGDKNRNDPGALEHHERPGVPGFFSE